MRHCESNPNKFTRIPDPYNHGRICYNFIGLERHDLRAISEDSDFAWLQHGIICFNNSDKES